MKRKQTAGIAVLFLLIILYHALDQEPGALRSLPRPQIGETAKSMDLEANMTWNGREYRFPVTLRIQPEQVQESDREQLLTGLSERIKAPLLGRNSAMDQISTPLQLLAHDPETGLAVRWKSSREDIVDPLGNVWTLGLTEATPVTLTASISLGEQDHEWVFDLIVVPPAGSSQQKWQSEKSQKQQMEHLLQQIVTGLEKNDRGSDLILPSSTPGEIKLQWNKPKSRLGYLMILPALGWLLILQSRKAETRKMQHRKEEMLKDYHALLDQLVMLLGAGLVVQTALTRISQEYEAHLTAGRTRPLYEELREVQQRIHTTRTSLAAELQQMGRRSELMELNRFAMIISDHLQRGTSLTEKLEAEQRQLWFQRKKAAEERGKLADTRMVAPMMLQLLAVILISIAPVLLELE